MHRYAEEEKSFLRENAEKCTYPELVEMFADNFGVQVTLCGLQQYCRKILGVKCRTNRHVFNDTEKEWLKLNIDKGTYEEIATLFNTAFGTNVSKQSISDVCTKRMHLRKSENKGNFCSHQERKKLPVGTERKYNGYWHIKVDDKYHEGITTRRLFAENWKLKQVYVYEQAHGKIPDGSIVVFLDNDNENFSLENLYCIDKKILSVMNSNSWFKKDPSLTLTAIKWCELFYAIKAVRD
jgi:hypothetical protein